MRTPEESRDMRDEGFGVVRARAGRYSEHASAEKDEVRYPFEIHNYSPLCPAVQISLKPLQYGGIFVPTGEFTKNAEPNQAVGCLARQEEEPRVSWSILFKNT